jgi:hypothetical protein
MQSAGNLMRFVTKFAGKSPAKLENEEHDEDHEDLHPEISRSNKMFQKSVKLMSIHSPCIIQQEFTNHS